MEDIPMGVSQWRAHGRKYGYWGFHIKALLWGLRMEKIKADSNTNFGDNFVYGFNKAVQEQNKEIKKLIKEQ